MNNEIIPMSKSEIKLLDSALFKIKDMYRKAIEDRMMNEGFSTVKVLNYDNDFILVQVEYGISLAIPESCFSNQVAVDRHSMEVIQPNGFFS